MLITRPPESEWFTAWIGMRGSRNFHERGSNENGNFWSQTRGGVQPLKNPEITFLAHLSRQAHKVSL